MQDSIVFLFVGLFLRTIQFSAHARDSFRYFDYDVDAFHRLTSHKISSVVVNSMEDCAMACLAHWECFSFNLGNLTMAGKHECELIRTDKYNSNSTYSNSNDFHHFFVRNPCGSGKTVCRNGGTCYPVYEDSSYKCVCRNGYNGRNCENTGMSQAKSCLEWLQHGYNKSGVYTIVPEGGVHLPPAFCDMTTDGGGWLVFLRRKDGTVDFDRSRRIYRLGFGDILGEFWFGLANINRITKERNRELRVELEDWDGNTAYAKYSTFKVATGDEHFRLTVSGYSGTAGDSLSVANGMNFSTKDLDHDGKMDVNCAENLKAGWWFTKCFTALLTGQYGKLIKWSTWKGFGYSLKSCEMKLRRLP
ncbi:hypothetical protein ACROYT_G006877 [Oculina patagonica]